MSSTAIVSVAHRVQLAAYHSKRFTLVPNGDHAELVTSSDQASAEAASS